MSIIKWLTGGLSGGDALASARLDAELQELAQAVLPAVREGRVRTVAVVSAEAGEGRTTTACHLAELLADNLNDRVLLIDADPIAPSLHEEYELPETPGWSDLLAGVATLDEAVRSTLHDNLALICAGDEPASGQEEADLERLAATLSEAAEQAAAVVVDTGPLLDTGSAAALAHQVDAVILVVLAGITQGEIAARAQRILARAKADLLGVVVNDPRGEFVRDER